MDNVSKKVITCLSQAKLLRNDIYASPSLLYDVLCKGMPEEQEFLEEYKDVFLSDASAILYKQINNQHLDIQEIYDTVHKACMVEDSMLSTYIFWLMSAEGVERYFAFNKRPVPSSASVVNQQITTGSTPNQNVANQSKVNQTSQNYNQNTVRTNTANSNISNINTAALAPEMKKIDLTRPERKKTAQEYYLLALEQKTNVGIQDKEIYIENLKKAADQKHPEAISLLAHYYLKGKFVEEDKELGKRLLLKSAAMGNVESQYEIFTFSKRFPGLFSEMEVISNLKLAASTGNLSATFELAMKYYENGTPQDYERAVSLLTECVEHNDPEAMYRLALCYRYGHGVNKEISKAMELLKSAAALGYPKAIEIVGTQG